MSSQPCCLSRYHPRRLGRAILALMAAATLSGCAETAVAPGPVQADQKPALAAPPASMMTPQGY